jgi:hypothetical protein
MSAAQHLYIDLVLPPGIVLTRWVGETWKLALPPNRVDELADFYEAESKRLRNRAPVQAGGEMPAGTIAWYEFQQIHASYAQRFGALAHNPESIINRGGFTYQEIQEYIGKDPETWMIAD